MKRTGLTNDELQKVSPLCIPANPRIQFTKPSKYGTTPSCCLRVALTWVVSQHLAAATR
ncbi:hypothetical protein O9992_12705 [Vibrio lentus]|nr:hypothetical protein [Vibrio lentus]